MEAIVVRALTKITTDCPRRQSNLKRQCRDTLEEIHRNDEEERLEDETPDTDANKYMPCLLAACSSGVPKVVTTALDTVVKLIDYGYIRDVEIDSDDEDEDDVDEVVQLREGAGGDAPGAADDDDAGAEAEGVPPTLDPSLDPTSSSAAIHGDPEVPPPSESVEGEGDGKGVEGPASPGGGVVAEAAGAEGGGTSAEAGAPQQQQQQQQQQQPRFLPQRMLMDEVVERVCDCDLETEDVQLQVIKALVHACTATTLSVHRASLLTAVKTIYTVHLSTHDSINKNTAKASLQQMLSVVFSRMEAKDAQLKEEAAAAAELEALRESDPLNYPRPPPPEPEPEPQPEPMPEPVFNIPDTMYKEVAEAMEMPELYKTVPDLPPEEVSARRKRYKKWVEKAGSDIDRIDG